MANPTSPLSTRPPTRIVFFFFNDTATTEIYTLSLHDALPICDGTLERGRRCFQPASGCAGRASQILSRRSEEHTSELQSPCNLVCRLLLEKKKTPLLATACARRVSRARWRTCTSRTILFGLCS